ncbi:hypothetical protein GCM10022290_13030 [Sagittula marina]
MWSSETNTKVWRAAGMTRRAAVLALIGSVAACGFTPVYGPQGGGTALVNAIDLPEPSDDSQYVFNRRFEERMGRGGGAAPYRLTTRIQIDDQDIGATSAGSVTRVRLIGRVFFTLTDTATGEVVRDARTNAFTGYSTTGATVATSAAQRDAQERLMILLADQVIDDLVLHVSNVPTAGSTP